MKTRRIAGSAAVLAAALVVASLSARTVSAADPLVGTWKLVSYVSEAVETKERIPVYGPTPSGIAVFTPEQRLITVITAAGRKPPQSEADRAALFGSQFAITGKYRVEGSKYVLKVDVAGGPRAVGMELVRDFAIEGNRLTITTAPGPDPLLGGRMGRGITVWEREAK